MARKESSGVKTFVIFKTLGKIDLLSSIGSLAMTRTKFTTKILATSSKRYTAGKTSNYKIATSNQDILLIETSATPFTQLGISSCDTNVTIPSGYQVIMIEISANSSTTKNT
jgi:hypothetical protein